MCSRYVHMYSGTFIIGSQLLPSQGSVGSEAAKF